MFYIMNSTVLWQGNHIIYILRGSRLIEKLEQIPPIKLFHQNLSVSIMLDVIAIWFIQVHTRRSTQSTLETLFIFKNARWIKIFFSLRDVIKLVLGLVVNRPTEEQYTNMKRSLWLLTNKLATVRPSFHFYQFCYSAKGQVTGDLWSCEPWAFTQQSWWPLWDRDPPRKGDKHCWIWSLVCEHSN